MDNRYSRPVLMDCPVDVTQALAGNSNEVTAIHSAFILA